jgi:hypothetical protein
MRISAVGVVCLVVACGGGGGTVPDLPPSKLLVDLTTAEYDELCQYEGEVLQGPRTVQCGSGTEAELPSVTECDAGESNVDSQCTATVGDAEACFNAIEADPCHEGGSACTAVLAC